MMMSSCLSAGSSRAFGLDLDIVKFTSTSTSSRNSQTSASSSPSSTLSESTSNNTLFSNRKPRTPRKRPNQTYNEAAVLLSSAYPTIFPTKHSKSTATAPPLFLVDSSELLLQPCQGPLPSFNRIIQSFKSEHRPPLTGNDDDFETTSSILDEEMEGAEGIDSIMGVASTEFSEPALGDNGMGRASGSLGFTGLLMRRGITALRQVDNGDWWRFPVIDMRHISPRLLSNSQDQKSASPTKLKKKKKNYSSDAFPEDVEPEPVIVPNLTSSLMLKLNYKGVADAWSDRGSPFDEMPQPPDMSAPNAHEMILAQIDLFGVREASVLRYKEKRRTRLFSKKIIRYQVRKLNADCRPRMKGRFVTRHNCQTMKKKI